MSFSYAYPHNSEWIELPRGEATAVSVQNRGHSTIRILNAASKPDLEAAAPAIAPGQWGRFADLAEGDKVWAISEATGVAPVRVLVQQET